MSDLILNERFWDLLCNAVYLTAGMLILVNLSSKKGRLYPRWDRVAQGLLIAFLILGPLFCFIRFFGFQIFSHLTNRLLWRYDQQLHGAAVAMLVFLILSGGFGGEFKWKKKRDADSTPPEQP